MTSPAMPRRWFRKFGWYYRPVSVAGWALSAAMVAASVWAFFVVDRQSHSASDTLIDVFPYVALFAVILGRIAHHTSAADE